MLLIYWLMFFPNLTDGHVLWILTELSEQVSCLTLKDRMRSSVTQKGLRLELLLRGLLMGYICLTWMLPDEVFRESVLIIAIMSLSCLSEKPQYSPRRVKGTD